jgi:predicted nucleic acid-binding protein
MLVFDASPLIHLTKTGKIEYIIQAFGPITISTTVYAEVITKGLDHGYADAALLKRYHEGKKIHCKEVEDKINPFKGYLHDAEYHSIQIAEHEKALLVIDERKGRIIAKQKNVPFQTTLGMMLILLKEKKIDPAHYLDNLNKYAENGWISTQVRDEFKNKVNKDE